MIVELDDYEDELIKIQDLLLTLQFCLEHCRCINSDTYYLETLSSNIIKEYDRLLEKLYIY